MFVDEQRGYGADADEGQHAELQREDQRQKTGDHHHMKELSGAKRAGDTEHAREAEEAFGAIELVVLTGVDDVEAGGPKGDGGGEPQNSRVERAADGDPGGGRCDAEREAEHQMRERREALGEGVEEDDGERGGREVEAERVEG